MPSNQTGTLYVVATPLGNLEDITFRAVKVLETVDLIAAEDTRHSKKLLNHYNIQSKLISCHEHNEIQKTDFLIKHLKNGLNIALISDAGTPSISDPGYRLIKRIAQENIPIIPIPGCCAAIAGLCVSALPTDKFHFYGFLPKKTQKLQQALESLKYESSTLIFYESPRRIKKLVETAREILEDRPACLAREISKIHEEYLRGKLSDILKSLEKKDKIKGECSLFIQGYDPQKNSSSSIDEESLRKIIQDRLPHTELKTAELAKQIAGEYGIPRKQVYSLILNHENTKG